MAAHKSVSTCDSETSLSVEVRTLRRLMMTSNALCDEQVSIALPRQYSPGRGGSANSRQLRETAATSTLSTGVDSRATHGMYELMIPLAIS